MLGIVERSSEMELADWVALSKEEQAARTLEVETRYLKAGVNHVIADLRRVLKLLDLKVESGKERKGEA